MRQFNIFDTVSSPNTTAIDDRGLVSGSVEKEVNSGVRSAYHKDV